MYSRFRLRTLEIRHLQETADLVTLTEEIFNGKFHFLGSRHLRQKKLIVMQNKFKFMLSLS